MARFSNAAEWDPGVTEATEADPGAPALGSTYRLVVRAFGRAVPLEYRIAEFDRPHRVVLSAENSMVRSTDVIEVSADPGGGSILTYDATLELKGAAVAVHPPARPRRSGASGTGPSSACAPHWRHDRWTRTPPGTPWPGPPTPWPRPRWSRASAASASDSAAGWRSGATRPRWKAAWPSSPAPPRASAWPPPPRWPASAPMLHLVGRDPDRGASRPRHGRGDRPRPGPPPPGRPLGSLGRDRIRPAAP